LIKQEQRAVRGQEIYFIGKEVCNEHYAGKLLHIVQEQFLLRGGGKFRKTKETVN